MNYKAKGNGWVNKVDNAIIMAAGTSSRFIPISYEKPKALIEVKGEILIERQICQLKEAGISEIIIVVGYKKEQFYYLQDKFGVIIVENTEYTLRNNHSSIYAVREYLKNSYICSADNYFSVNPFQREEQEAFYAAVYADAETKEWCLEADNDGWIRDVTIGGAKAWYMLGHVFWDAKFSETFVQLLKRDYENLEIIDKLWEAIYMENLAVLKMKIKKYHADEIYEFDSLEELREFDGKYKNHSGSEIMQNIVMQLQCQEEEIVDLLPRTDALGNVSGFAFSCQNKVYHYQYAQGKLKEKKV